MYETLEFYNSDGLDLKDILKDRKIVIAREITKIHEEYIRGTVDEIFKIVDNLKGEMILIIDKNENINKIEDDLNNLTLEEHYEFYKNQGLEKKEIIKKIAKDRNVNKNEIYKMFIKIFYSSFFKLLIFSEHLVQINLS